MQKVFLLVTSLMISAISAFADGKITGKIADQSNNEAIAGAELYVLNPDSKDTLSMSFSDVDGGFVLDMPAGNYELSVGFEGYITKIITDVTIAENEVKDVNITLQETEEATEIGEVVIRVSFTKESINSLYVQQKTAATVSDGISADVISKSPDRNTGEVLKRISGTSIQDNKFVVVRGMNDRYNVVMVDNALLPSTEPNRKAFSFDIIPSAMIDNIVITKSGSPDLPGDFSGGVINILSKEVPSVPYTNISIGTSYNTLSTFKDFKTGFKSSTDFLGFDDGSRQLPKDFLSFKDMQDPRKFNPNDPEASKKMMDKFNNDYGIKQRSALPGLNFQIAHGNTYELKNGHKFGVNAGLTFQHEERIKPNLLRQYDNFDYLDNIYSYKSNLGALVNLGYYTNKSKILFKNFYNRIFDDNYLERTGINYSSTTEVKYYAFDLIQKSLLKSTLLGEHQVGAKQSKLDWLLSYNLVTNNQPDQKKVNYSRIIGTDGPFNAELTTLGKANNRLFSDLKEHIVNAAVNYSIPLNILGKSSLKFGLAEQIRMRNFENRYLGAVLNTSDPDALNIQQAPIDQLFSQENIDRGYFRFTEQTIDGDIYKAQAATSAGYIMMDNLIANKYRFVYGLRAEHYYINLDSYLKNEVNKSWFNLLPSLNFTYMLNNRTNLRASYFQSLVRPELREMANMGYYDYELGAIFTGNPTLVQTQIHNIDLKYEYFPYPGEILSASVFYKNFKNTIENSVYAAMTAYEVKPENYEGGYSVGVELEIRKKLDFISNNNLFRNLSFYTNASFVHSSIKLPDNYIIQGEVIKTRALSGQSPLVINSSLGYLSENGKFGANVLYNYIGSNLYMIGNDRIGNVFVASRHILDLQASYNINPKMSLRLSVKDLLNSPYTFFMDQDVNGKFERNYFKDGHIEVNKDWIWQEYRPGTSIGLSFNYNF